MNPASTAAITYAEQNGVDLSIVAGSGKGGRIVKADIEAAVTLRESRFAGAKSGVQNPSQWLMDWLGSGKSSTGLDVHETTAMQSMAVYACVKVLAEAVGSLPMEVYTRLDGGGKALANKHPLYRILHNFPNPEMTALDFRETMMTHLLLWGNAYAEIERDVSGRPIALWPLRPDRMQIWRGFADTNYQLEYWYSLYTGGMTILAPSEVLHLKNLSIDGIRGLSPIAHQREAVGLALALESYAGHFFGNDATPGGFLSHPGKLSENARANLKAGWEAGHRGLDNSSRMAVFEEGITFQKVGIPPEDAQFLQSRQFQLTEIARMYRVPAHLIGDMGRVTHANIEHLGIDFVTHTMRPIAVTWEQAIQQKLFLDSEQDTYFAEFLFDALLRGDIATRYASYAIARTSSFMSVNEIRLRENLNPISDADGGNDYIQPLNMGPLGTVPQAASPIPAPQTDLAESEGAGDSGSGRSLDWGRWFKRELDVIGRIERERVLQNAQKTLPKGDLRGFQRFLLDFYTEKLTPIIADKLSPVFGEKTDLTTDYIAHFAAQHSRESLEAAQGALATHPGDELGAIEGLLSGWEATRSLAIIKRERWSLRMTMAPDMEPDGDEMDEPEAPPVNNFYITVPERSVTVQNHVQPANATVEIAGDTINVAPAAVTVGAPDVINNVTVEPAAVTVEPADIAITVQPADVTVPVTIEGDTTNILPGIAPDITILPAEVTVNLPTPEPSRGVSVLYDSAGKVIGTAPRSAPKPEDSKAKPKAKK